MSEDNESFYTSKGKKETPNNPTKQPDGSLRKLKEASWYLYKVTQNSVYLQPESTQLTHNVNWYFTKTKWYSLKSNSKGPECKSAIQWTDHTKIQQNSLVQVLSFWDVFLYFELFFSIFFLKAWCISSTLLCSSRLCQSTGKMRHSTYQE